MINADFVWFWAAKYPKFYDTQYYEPYIQKARSGDIQALRKLTEWKNGGNSRPMPLSKNKEKAFQNFIHNLNDYLKENGSAQLRLDFKVCAPVWSIFWHHVLYNTPIFDVYTHMAYHFSATGDMLTKKQAKISASVHWSLYDRYVIWFHHTFEAVKAELHSLTERELDRALVCWGEAQNKSSKNQCF